MFNIDEMRNTESEFYNIPLCDAKWVFYYDETGNCRRLSLRENGINAESALKEDFVLGGVVFDAKDVININTLFCSLQFKNKMTEIKFKHISENEKEFLKVIEKKNVNVLLDWLINNRIDIHYETLNTLYYSLVDIVDSTLEVHYDQGVGFPPEWINELKSSLYEFVIKNRTDILSLLYRYEYPNVKKERMQAFSSEITDMISNCVDSDGFFIEMFRQMLKYAGRQQKLTFLDDVQPFLLVKDYSGLYLQRCYTFKYSKHIFDNEPYVAKRLNEINPVSENKPFKNYEFQDSKSNKYIQLSDLIVGLLSKLFQWLDSFNRADTLEIKKGLKQIQMQQIKKINCLINRAERRNTMLISNSNSVKCIRDRAYKLEILAKD